MDLYGSEVIQTLFFLEKDTVNNVNQCDCFQLFVFYISAKCLR